LAGKMEQFFQHSGLAVLEILLSPSHNVYPMVLGGNGLDEMTWGEAE